MSINIKESAYGWTIKSGSFEILVNWNIGGMIEDCNLISQSLDGECPAFYAGKSQDMVIPTTVPGVIALYCKNCPHKMKVYRA